MPQPKSRPHARLCLEVLETRDLMSASPVPATAVLANQSFDNTALGTLPAGWSQWSNTAPFAVSGSQALSPRNGLTVTAAQSDLSARAWYGSAQPANVQASASIFLNNSIPGQV